MPTLKEQVKQICNRLSPHGWGKLFYDKHGLDISAQDLEVELLRELKIDRTARGFEDFAYEGRRGIEPGQPARSLLYHALASPNVTIGVDGSQLEVFPTLAELEIIENYVFGIKPPSKSDLISRVGDELALVVFATEYRPAPETVHRKHADLCFSRTGVARVGTAAPLYHPPNRGFLPFIEGNDFAFRVLPARYSVYIAVKRLGNENEFGPMRFNKHHEEEEKNDMEREFWVPIHKVFSGTECIKDYDLHVTLEAHHVNEKLYRVHQELNKKYDNEPEYYEYNNKTFPFIIKDGIAEFSDETNFGSNVLVPIPHSRLVEIAKDNDKIFTFNVPKELETFYGSLLINSHNGRHRSAPEYVHVHHAIVDGKPKSFNDMDYDEVKSMKINGYNAPYYIDYTGDGWIGAVCKGLDNELHTAYSAYSLVTAPDFFPNCDQWELLEWGQSLPKSLQNYLWEIDPYTLSDNRVAANLELKEANFIESDDTMTAIISLPYGEPAQATNINVLRTTRHSYLPDAASGVFAPGWDVSVDQSDHDVEFLAAYGLGSPFPEDSKLCAALSTFWPAVAPDAARTFEQPYPSVSPLTDEEIGQVGNLPWDGVIGPKVISKNGEEFIEYPTMEYVNYIDNALENKFTLSLTGLVDTKEYANRVLNMAFVYKFLGVKLEGLDRNTLRGRREITRRKGEWRVLSFQKVSSSNDELKTAQSQTGTILTENIYRFEIYKNDAQPIMVNSVKARFKIKEKSIIFIDEKNILFKKGNEKWDCENVKFL
ncbi:MULTISPECIES: hypothetical protein [Bacillus]|uniref:Uncharacterized protein n=1 Tax=Bacillus cereus TaxID=1396 RepID=A0AAN5XI56_BACCE|nr:MULTISPECIES: hypothetical protein [Bacillus]AXR17081.1 hypothetical protein DOS87_13635 [Bacillus sp. CR71]AXR22775.1 hypothetical protein DPQ26_13400 [Bacillus sp. E25]KAB2446027.1 hypothetical protein F8165_28235 [Bacillus cereus]KAB2486776.1 hypothetical protein F8157_09475 [Bacillus cereus]OJE33634.1 hypothetical protein A9490_20455 [Bacillus thuringiensis]